MLKIAHTKIVRKKKTPQPVIDLSQQPYISPIPPRSRRIPHLPLTVLICTPDATLPHARACIESFHQTAGHVECTLMIRDNNRRPGFSHAAELNEVLNLVGPAGILVTCDDDVTFTPGWQDAALDIAENEPDVGVVAFSLWDHPGGGLWSSGMWHRTDGARYIAQIDTPHDFPSQCSACWLIMPTETRFNENYLKHSFEHDFTFQLWEQGKRTIVLPNAIYHTKNVSAKAVMGVADFRVRSQKDHGRIQKDWVESGRIYDVYDKIRLNCPVELPRRDNAMPGLNLVHPLPPERRGGPEKRAVVTIRCGSDNADLYDVTLPLLRRYARKCGADLIVVDDNWRTNELHPCALKAKCGTILDVGYDRVLYVDGMDIFVRPETPSLFDIVPKDRMGAFDEAPICDERFEVKRFATMQDYVKKFNLTHGASHKLKGFGGYFNAGVLLFDKKNNPFQWGIEWFDGDYLYDQTCANVMAFLHGVPVHWLDRRYNSLLGIAYDEDPHPDDYLLHFCSEHGKEHFRGWLSREWVTPIERPDGPSTSGLERWFQMANPSTMVEVGSAHGESSFIFTGLNPDLKITCIDPWEKCKELAGRYGEKARRDFERRHAGNQNVKAIASTGHETASTFCGQVDAVYIDAMHTYGTVKQDIADWLPHVRKGGVIGGHDYCDQWDGVKRAVNEAFGGPDMVFEDTSWLVIKKENK